MNFSERLNKEKLNESMEQEFGTTYKFKVKILFEGLDETERIMSRTIRFFSGWLIILKPTIY